MERLSGFVLISCFIDKRLQYQAFATSTRTTEQHFNKVIKRKRTCRARTAAYTHFARIGNLCSLVPTGHLRKPEISSFSGKNKDFQLVPNSVLVQGVIE